MVEPKNWLNYLVLGSLLRWSCPWGCAACPCLASPWATGTSKTTSRLGGPPALGAHVSLSMSMLCCASFSKLSLSLSLCLFYLFWSKLEISDLGVQHQSRRCGKCVVAFLTHLCCIGLLDHEVQNAALIIILLSQLVTSLRLQTSPVQR